MSTPLDLIVAWHDAVRDRDLEAVAGLVHSDVEVGGPKGSGHGVDLIREWVQTSGIGLEIESFLQRGLTFVVGQEATWPDPDAAGGRTQPVAVASVFVVQGARISKILRFDEAEAALEAAGFRSTPN
ncbi:MAG: nuclear transport factor 2 family protein [Geodermatophilaceae bacterium]|nr:nuclear transport factor 2 family protein [Geodermatophilaceae bacterium]